MLLIEEASKLKKLCMTTIEKLLEMEPDFRDNVVDLIRELKAPKSQWNDFSKYHYRNAEDILESLKSTLEKRGLLPNLSDEIVMVGDRYYVKATASLTDGKNIVSSTAYAREEETKKGYDSAQITGATSSYARKYALNALLCIDDTKDPDYDGGGSKPAAEPAKKPTGKTSTNKTTAKPTSTKTTKVSPPADKETESDLRQAFEALEKCKDNASVNEVMTTFKNLWDKEDFKEAVKKRRAELDAKNKAK